MKANKLRITLITIVIGFVVILSGLIFYASQKLNPDELRKMALEQLQVVFPESQISLGEVRLSFGLSAKVDVESLSIRLKQDDELTPMLEVEDLKVRIPIWAILTGGGTIETTLTRPTIHFEELDGSNNWLLATGKTLTKEGSKVEQGNKKESVETSELAIPLFLVSSAINLKVTDLNLSYDLGKNRGNVKLNRFLIKNLNIKDPTAFEIDSLISFDLADDSQKVQFHTLMIGEFDLSSYLAKEDLKLKTMIKLTQLKAPGLVSNVPELSINLQTTISLEGQITSGVNGEFAQSKFSFTVDLIDDEIRVENIVVDLLLDSLYQLSTIKVPGLNAGRAKMLINGQVHLSENKGITPELNYKLEPAVSYNFNDNQLMVTSQGKLQNKKLNISNNIDAFGGTIVSEVRGNLDLNQKEFSIDKLNPFEADVNISNFKFNRAQLNKVLYPTKPASSNSAANEGSSAVAASAVAAPIFLPRVVVNLNVDNFFIEDNELVTKAKFIVGKDQFVSEYLNLNYANGEGKLIHTTKVLPGFDLNNTFTFTMKNLDLGGLNAFLPPSLSALKGKFSGSFKGKADLKEKQQPNFDIDVDVTATEGEIIGLDLSESINSLVASLPIIKDQLPEGKAYDFDSNFDYLLFKGKVTDKRYTISSFEFRGIDKKVELKGDGYLGALNSKGKSEVTLIAIDHSGKISNALQKNIGTNQLPIRLTGLEMNLRPDLEYTLGRVAKSALKNQVQQRLNDEVKEKVKEKVDDKVEEQVERLKEQGLDQLNKLLRRR
jgi:hypothetical protein